MSVEARTSSNDFLDQAHACVVTCAQMLREKVDISRARAVHPDPTAPNASPRLITILRRSGLQAKLTTYSREDFHTLLLPSAVCLDEEWVVVIRQRQHYTWISRANGKRQKLRTAAVYSATNGAVIEVSAGNPNAAPRRRISSLSLFRLTPDILWTALQSLALSVVLQAYVLASPLLMRLVIDDVTPTGDEGLLTALATGFALLALFNGGASLLRGVTFQQLNTLLSWEAMTRTLVHVLELPLIWFQARKATDLLVRLQSLDQVRSVLTNSLGAVIDGALAIFTLAMLAALTPSIALMSAIGLALYVVLRLSTIQRQKRLSDEVITATIDDQHRRLELLRGIQSVKLSASEGNREREWSRRYLRTLVTFERSHSNLLVFGTIQSLVVALTTIGSVYFGALAVIDGDMTIGFLTAALAYQSQLLQRGTALFDQVVSWKMLDVHLDRLTDMMLEPREQYIASQANLKITTGSVDLEGVSFRYGVDEPWILKNFSAHIRAGEFVVVTAPSGTGKSTLLKLICGLYQAERGTLLVDGQPFEKYGLQYYRSRIGAVLQDDQLSAGTIAENVADREDQIDWERVQTCLQLACIADDVVRMPLGLDSVVGEAGSKLSAGQKQRVLLAKALYREPQILVLDEITSQLDEATEARLLQMLTSLSMTRIVVSHKPQTIKVAERVISLERS